MTEGQLKMGARKVSLETRGKSVDFASSDLSHLSQSNSEDSERGCSVGCFAVRSHSGEGKSSPKSGRHWTTQSSQSGSGSAFNWKCPDPGCKTNNACGQNSCGSCNLPRHSANHFKRGESKILKQL